MSDDFAASAPGSIPRLRPTDLSQFIRLDQCERYLRLRLHERSVNARFMGDYGVETMPITPLLTRSGAEFEQSVMADVAAHFDTTLFASEGKDSGNRSEDNAQIVDAARGLLQGQVHVFFQTRLDVILGGWHVRGDVDILRLCRTADGTLDVLIADIKSSTSAKVEHRLQVAFYAEMLDAIFAVAAVPHAAIGLAVLYKGSSVEGDPAASAAERAAACAVFGTEHGYLELVADADAYRRSVRDLVTAPDSTAARIMATPFDDLAFHLEYKCDGCVYNEFCMKRTAERDDLSLVPHLTGQEKGMLLRAGVGTVRDLATMKEPSQEIRTDSGERSFELVPAAGREEQCRTLATTRPVGGRLDELIYRARQYRGHVGDEGIDAAPYIPHKGYGSLPYADETQNPNLIRIYLDAQKDYLEDRLYLVGALVVGCEGGVERPDRRRSVVETTQAVSDASGEEALLLRWTTGLLRAIAEVAAPDANGEMKAPIHLIFYDALAQKALLEGLARHFKAIFGATPLYDFVTQLAAFDSPILSYLNEEIRTQKNYPLICQSLQSVAAWRGFTWDTDIPFRQLFKVRMFDSQGRPDWDDATREWYTRRARFNSSIPLEYAYAALGVLPQEPARGKADAFAPYRATTLPLLAAFDLRRLEAMEWVARDFTGNRYTEKTCFDLSHLATFTQKAESLARAMEEFVTLERHVELGAWKAARFAPPERRVLTGETLIVRYESSLNTERERIVEENTRRAAIKREITDIFLAANPTRKRKTFSDTEKALFAPLEEPLTVHFVLDCTGVECDPTEALSLTNIRPDEWLVLSPRWKPDERLPIAEQVPLTPTAKRLLYGQRAILSQIDASQAAAGTVIIDLELITRSPKGRAGYVFYGFAQELVDGERYTLDTNPNNVSAAHELDVIEQLCAVEEGARSEYHTLYDHVTERRDAAVIWPDEAKAAQDGFLWGVSLRYPFEDEKQRFIGEHGDAPVLLVQGPPGTGKSFSTAYALFARLQGAMAAGRPFRIFVSCHSHAAIDVVMEKVRDVQVELQTWQREAPETFEAHFDARLLDVPLYRVGGKDKALEGVEALVRGDLTSITESRWCVVGATPGAIYGMAKERWSDTDLLGHGGCDCLVLDEASQMNLPEAMMAALLLEADGQVIVVGDHRQMPPIIKHDWEMEPRRTFAEYRAYDSLFQLLYTRDLPTIKFAESFRLHADMAEFLREEIYRHDEIAYFSALHDLLPDPMTGDPFVDAVLAREYPIVVVVHEETGSQFRNEYEQVLITPVLEALTAAPYFLGPKEGIGVVVPHRAQRALLREHIPALNVVDPVTGIITASSVDTVERFQGSERTVILLSATESDRMYLLASSAFLFDPRRLTVALSRAKRKVIVVASRSVFSLFSADEETFANAQLWKNLLRRTCTVQLWDGIRDGNRVVVWGNT